MEPEQFKKGCYYSLIENKKVKSIILMLFEHDDNSIWRGWKHYEHCSTCYGSKLQNKK